MSKKYLLLMLCSIVPGYAAQVPQGVEVRHIAQVPRACTYNRIPKQPQHENDFNVFSRKSVCGGSLYILCSADKAPDGAQYLRDNLHHYFEQADGDTIEKKMKHAFGLANDRMWGNSCKGSASVCVVWIKNNEAHIAHAGDCCAVLVQNQKIQFKTKAHTFYNETECKRVKGIIEHHKLPDVSLDALGIRYSKAYEEKHPDISTGGTSDTSRAVGRTGCTQQTITWIPEYKKETLTDPNGYIIIGSYAMWWKSNVDNIVKKINEEITKCPLDIMVDLIGAYFSSGDHEYHQALMIVALGQEYTSPFILKKIHKIRHFIFFGVSLATLAAAFLCYAYKR